MLETTYQDSHGLRVGTAVLDLRSGRVKSLLRDGGSARYSPTGHLLFARQGTLFAVPFDRNKLEVKGEPVAIMDGLYQPFNQYPGLFEVSGNVTLFYPPAGGVARNRRLMMIDRAGKISEWSGEEKPSEFWIFASRDGSRCGTVVTGETAISEIWVSERGRPTSHKVATTPGANAFGGAWSADGTRIAYTQTTQDSTDGIYIANVDQPGPPRRVCGFVKPNEPLIACSWSPDGTTLLASTNDETFAIPVPSTPGTLAQPRAVFADKAPRYLPNFSPDGRLVAYVSHETGSRETFVCRWDGQSVVGTPLQVSVGGGGPAKWSRDGTKLYYENSQAKLMAVDIAETPTLRSGTPSVAWDLDALRIARFRGVGYLFDFLPDGRMLAVQKAEGEGDPTQINVVLNFGEELKERMRAAGGGK
jgi:serine/threonine-protein kinase